VRSQLYSWITEPVAVDKLLLAGEKKGFYMGEAYRSTITVENADWIGFSHPKGMNMLFADNHLEWHGVSQFFPLDNKMYFQNVQTWVCTGD
jgi:prepilin-type processing-associated H-X9-DG protein